MTFAAGANSGGLPEHPWVNLSQDDLISISDALPALISYVGTDHRYRMCNRAYTTWFGLEREQVLGRTMREVLGDATWRAIQPRVDAALGGETQIFEGEADYRFGGRRWIHAVYTPQHAADGAVIGIVVMVTDISARKQTEQQLRESEARFRALVSQATVGIAQVDLFGRFQLVNQRFCDLLGYSEAELLQMRMMDVTQAEDLPANLENFRALAQGGPDFIVEKRYIQKSGAAIWVQNNVAGVRNADGTLRGIMAVVLDISERKQAERYLRESEARFRNMSDNAPMMLWVTDSDGRCTHLNQRWYEFTGQTAEMGLGFGWLSAVHPDDRGFSERSFHESNAAKKAFRVEYRLRRRDGVYRWAIDAASPRFSDTGEYLGYIGSVIDIQERKEAEDALRKSSERFDIVKEGAQVGFWFCDLPFDELMWDNRVKEHFWLAPEDRVTIDTFYLRLHPDDRTPTRQGIERSIAERTRYDIEYRTVSPQTGDIKWIRAIGRTFYDPDGAPVRFDGVTLDITERKISEDALRNAKEQAEHASQAKDRFLAHLSHELRTPLTPVLMAAAALREDESIPAAAREQFGMIERNVALEARLIDDLLDLTRITHGKLALRSETCDIHLLLQLVVEILRDEAQEKQIDIALDLRASRYHLLGDSARLQQVFWNLLRNAVKFTAARGHIVLRSSNRDPVAGAAGEALVIEVIDDGIGFVPGISESLFRPFERGPAANDQRFPGLGLGLAIARAVVDLHGGKIRAESAGPGRGATFVVELDGASDGPARGHGPTRARSAPLTSDPVLRLLVVEDHAPTLQVLNRLLTRGGYEVTTATNVASALAAARQGQFDAVLSDLGLPDGTGLELMEQLRAEHGLRGIALSGYGMDEDIRRSQQAGFVAHLIKPVDLNEVRRVLRQFFSRSG